jgi:hypothetical protein
MNTPFTQLVAIADESRAEKYRSERMRERMQSFIPYSRISQSLTFVKGLFCAFVKDILAR